VRGIRPLESGLIGSRQAARALGISVPTLHRWVRNGRVPVREKFEGTTGSRIFNADDIDRIAGELAYEQAGDPVAVGRALAVISAALKRGTLTADELHTEALPPAG
jgi:DNA-binding transcriptional MerR regulator